MNYIKNFISYCETEKDLSPATISSYTVDLRQFTEYLNSIETDILHVDRDVIRNFTALNLKTKKRSSAARAITSLKSFYNFLEGEGLIEEAPTKGYNISQKERKLPQYLSKLEIKAIREAAKSSSLKDLLIVDLLYGTGARVSEIASLKLSNIDLIHGTVLIKGKGNKERLSPIHESCVKLIKSYMEQDSSGSLYLFPHRNDKSRHVTREGIAKTVKRLADKAGVDPDKVTPHKFRHSFATHLVDSGCDTSVVQEYLGHSDIATTKIYAKVSQKSKRDNFNKHHPLASL